MFAGQLAHALLPSPENGDSGMLGQQAHELLSLPSIFSRSTGIANTFPYPVLRGYQGFEFRSSYLYSEYFLLQTFFSLASSSLLFDQPLSSHGHTLPAKGSCHSTFCLYTCEAFWIPHVRNIRQPLSACAWHSSCRIIPSVFVSLVTNGEVSSILLECIHLFC